MKSKIKTYKTIGEFYDRLTRLKVVKNQQFKRELEFTGGFSLYQRSETPISSRESCIPLFNLRSKLSSKIQIMLSADFSSDKYHFNQYWIRWEEENKLVGFHVSIEEDSWIAHYNRHGESKVSGRVVDSKLVLDLIPELKQSR